MKGEGRILKLILLIFAIIIISTSIVTAPPPMPPAAPEQPATVEPVCSNTNEGIEICDSLDNDCDGFTDEEGCSAIPEDTTDTTTDSTSSSGSKKGGGGGGSSSGSSGILYLSEPQSSGTVVDQSTLPPDDESSGVDTASPEYLESFASQGASSTNSENSDEQDSSSESGTNDSYASVLFNDYRNMIIGSTALLLIAGVIIFTVVKNNNLKKNPQSTDKQGLTVQESTAVKYIHQMRANHYGEGDIKASMKRAGWDDKEIDKLIRK
jgi:hypothetical protein